MDDIFAGPEFNTEKISMAISKDDSYKGAKIATDSWINRHFRNAASLGVAHNVVGSVAQPPLHHDDVKWMLKEIADSSSVAAPVAKAMLLEARMATKKANKYKETKMARRAAAKSECGPERRSMSGRYDEQ
jgi:hypothetical protein